MGLGAVGGKSLTLENQRSMNLQNQLGDITRQQQEVIDNANFEIQQLMAQGRVQEAQAVADNASTMNNQLINKFYQDREYNFNQDRFGYQKERDKVGDTQWEKQFGLSEVFRLSENKRFCHGRTMGKKLFLAGERTKILAIVEFVSSREHNGFAV